MILVAGGDSFVFGTELKDQQKYQHSLTTYPALLAKDAGMDYSCAAWPGNANNAISRMTMRECQRLRIANKNQPIMIMITWTFLHRFEFRFNYDTNQMISPWHSINSWSMDKVNEPNLIDFSKAFYKHVGDNTYYQLYNSLKEILFMQNYLRQSKIPFMFTTADLAIFESPIYYQVKDVFLSDLYDQIEWAHWFSFPPAEETFNTQSPRGFYQWAVENKYTIGDTHPLEPAHVDAYILMKGKFNELAKKYF